jgi:DNA-binding NtrC family response regulator
VNAKRVLIVDDEPRMREMLERAVRELGFESSTAHSAEQAAKAMASEATKPSIIVLDLNLPGMDGLEFLKRVRAADSNIQVIILTGFGSIDAAKAAIRSDATDFLTKPCRLDELERALARAQRRARPEGLPVGFDEESANAATPADPAEVLPLDEVERRHILAALERRNGNRAAAAADLGISERTLYYRLARYQQQPPESHPES